MTYAGIRVGERPHALGDGGEVERQPLDAGDEQRVVRRRARR